MGFNQRVLAFEPVYLRFHESAVGRQFGGDLVGGVGKDAAQAIALL